MIAITGATGQLGRLVITQLKQCTAEPIVAIVRNLDKAASLADGQVQLRSADYNSLETLTAALKGVTRLLLISSSEVGQRTVQHGNVIAAAKAAGVPFIAYTSLLHADTSPLALATEHVATEKALKASGLTYALLRNGWYTENYTGSVGAAVAHGVVLGSSGQGLVSPATRNDFAAAAAAVLTGDASTSKVYELAGDMSFTMADYAAEISRQSGKPVVYQDMPQADYAAALVQIGLPKPLADIIADSSAKTKDGALYDNSHTLSALIRRPTTLLADVIAASLKA